MAMWTQNGPVRCNPFQRQYNSSFGLKVAFEEYHSKLKWTNLQLGSALYLSPFEIRHLEKYLLEKILGVFYCMLELQ